MSSKPRTLDWWSRKHHFRYCPEFGGGFGQGASISATVEILTQESVERPTVVVEAWVSRNCPPDDDGNDGGRGLEVEILVVDNKPQKMVFTTEDITTSHGPLPLQPFAQNFCAKVNLKTLFPCHFRTYGRLSMPGLTLALTTYNISATTFESLDFRNFGGDILLYDTLSSSSSSIASGRGGGVQTARGLEVA